MPSETTDQFAARIHVEAWNARARTLQDIALSSLSPDQRQAVTTQLARYGGDVSAVGSSDGRLPSQGLRRAFVAKNAALWRAHYEATPALQEQFGSAGVEGFLGMMAAGFRASGANA